MARIGGYAFVDDFGDVGTRSTSQNHFILGGYFTRPEDGEAIQDVLARARQEFGFPAEHVLHFASYSHERRVRLAQFVGKAPLTAFGAVLCKRAGPEKQPWHPERLYNWMIRLVLERASWYFDERGLFGSITFEHLKGHKIYRTHAYVERLKGLDTTIRWDALHLPLRFLGKAEDERLQVADTVSGAIGHAFHGAEGITELRYLYALEARLWRRGGRLASYGLKLQPPLGTEPPCATDHQWARSLLGPE